MNTGKSYTIKHNLGLTIDKIDSIVIDSDALTIYYTEGDEVKRTYIDVALKDDNTVIFFNYDKVFEKIDSVLNKIKSDTESKEQI